MDPDNVDPNFEFDAGNDANWNLNFLDDFESRAQGNQQLPSGNGVGDDGGGEMDAMNTQDDSAFRTQVRVLPHPFVAWTFV